MFNDFYVFSSGPVAYKVEKADRVVYSHPPEHRIGVRLGEREPDSFDYPGQSMQSLMKERVQRICSFFLRSRRVQR